jgi:spore germination protein YaaH
MTLKISDLILIGSLCLFAVSACSPTAAVESTPRSTAAAQTVTIPTSDRPISLGYYTGSPDSFKAVQNFAAYINIVSVDVYSVTPGGDIAGSDPLNVAAFDREHGIQTYACISNYNSAAGVNDFDPTLAKAAVATHKESLIPALVSLAVSGQYDGINIDFENIAFSDDVNADRNAFTSFIHELARELHGKGLKLIISVPAKTADEPDNSWAYPFDLAALGQDADYLQLMTYDEHGPWSEAGPVSGADWAEQVVLYSASIVDPAKLLLGLPAYGYDWVSDGSAGDFSWTDFQTLLTKSGVESRWEETSQTPWLTFSENGLAHTVWYENDKSLQAKTKLVESHHLGGWAVWALGKEDQNFWDAVTTKN